MRQIPFGKPIIGEEEKQAVSDVLNGPILVHGPRAETFEKNFATYTGANYTVCVSSCTAAMHLVYFYLGLGPGDEVIVPAQTHTSTSDEKCRKLFTCKPSTMETSAPLRLSSIARLCPINPAPPISRICFPATEFIYFTSLTAFLITSVIYFISSVFRCGPTERATEP